MSEVINIKKGLDIRLQGKAENIIGHAELPELFAIKPTDFHGVTPKLMVREGDQVKAGSVLFFDKYRPEIKFVSPVSGTVSAIIRGERRKVLEVVVKRDDANAFVEFPTADPGSLSRQEVIGRLLEAGAWPLIRQRPYDVIANANDNPKAIFISAFESAPLAPDCDFVVNGQEKYLQAGIEVMKKLCNNVHVGINADAASKPYLALKGIQLHKFDGPHPAGNVGVQISKISPINKGETVWVTQPQDLIIMGRLFVDGVYDSTKNILLAGSEVVKPAYYRTRIGACITPLITNNVKEGSIRYISGNVLTGKQITADGYLGYYHNQITVIPEGDYFEFMGWAAPGLGKYSVSRSFFSWLCSKTNYRMDANLHGGHRAIVVSGQYDKVLPMDILPEYLIKAIMAEDIDKMEQLGIYEVVEEDLALCEFVCTSKINIQEIVRNGINLMMKEMN
ncbi:MAG: Na(+)-translocating NADH-quinone reductase subunit A [Marinilabiliaceae bacterium]|nr:Na(+)-translocating NADH-quinone reductase subunit A [Marinilabiliaceae bacterium]